VHAALRLARASSDVSSVALGRDGQTIVLHYRDGHELVVVPSRPVMVRLPSLGREPHIAADGGSAKALVLEPFATELGLGASAGEQEVEALRAAGFSVDVYRDGQVTIPVMQQIPQYAVTYIETHAAVMPNGDAVVVSGETDPGPYADYYRDHTLAQATVSGDPTKALYNSVTGAFFIAHTAPFSAGSLLYINGCSVLSAPTFWSALQSRGLRALISWDGESAGTTDETAGSFVLNKLSQGLAVDPVVADAVTQGVGVSLMTVPPAHLGYRGNGQETLADALHATDPPTPTAVPTPTATPAPSPTAVKKSPTACKRGYHRSHGRCVKTKHSKKRKS
jgi:hypothetical protein